MSSEDTCSVATATPSMLSALDKLDYTITSYESNRGKNDNYVYPTYDILSYFRPPKEKSDFMVGRCKVGKCAVFWIIVIMILLVSWSIVVPLYFTGVFSSATTTDNVTVSIEEIPVSNFVQNKNEMNTFQSVASAVNGTLRITNIQYTGDLDSPLSTMYLSFRNIIEKQLQDIFMASELSNSFQRAAVLGFRPGSVIVDYVLTFTSEDLGSQAVPQVTYALKSYLQKYQFGPFKLDNDSIKFKYIQHRCKVNNGGCSHICGWDFLTDTVHCSCPDPVNYYLASDSKTCLRIPFTTTLVPCLKGQFRCMAGKCIPWKWVCDGNMDCSYGNDEAESLCGKNVKTSKSITLNRETGSKNIYSTTSKVSIQESIASSKTISKRNPSTTISPETKTITVNPHTGTKKIALKNNQLSFGIWKLG